METMTWEVTAIWYDNEGEHATSVIVTTAPFDPPYPESSADMVPPQLMTWARDVWAPSCYPADQPGSARDAQRLQFAHHRPAHISATAAPTGYAGQGACSFVVHDTWDTHYFSGTIAGEGA